MLKRENCPHLTEEAHKKIEEYLQWSPSQQSAQDEVEALLKEAASNETTKVVEDRFVKRLQFGTAGLRGIMGCGFNCMNDLIVTQTTQGLAAYLLQVYGHSECEKRGVVVGFDGRYNSQQFAHTATAVFLSKGIRVYLNSSLVPTPLVPYTIIQYNCLAGVQITASHNPKNDNGYKVYGSNGAQIIPPVDTEISALILKNLKPWEKAVSLLDVNVGAINMEKLNVKEKQLLTDPTKEIRQKYIETITQKLSTNRDVVTETQLKFVYTPMHGVGYECVDALLKMFGLKSTQLCVVEKQKNPDPEFSTVCFPNPEEKGALDLSIELANQIGASIILANDPDADRFACAEKQNSAEWKIFSGDELGLIFAYHALERFKKKHVANENMLFLCSAVSSRMLQRLCEIEGCTYTETMTGFKWIMNKAIELTQQKPNSTLQFCFAYEEALGYALDLSVPDKDGISACAVWVEMTTELYKKNLTISQHLERLYQKYGYSVTNNSYFKCFEINVIKQIFTEFRNNGKYKTHLGRFSIKRIRDVSMRYDNGEKNNECQLPFIPASEMITLYFDNGVTITFRTSGTEPKLKWYSELISSNPKEAKIELQNTLDDTIMYFIQYPKYKEFLHKA